MELEEGLKLTPYCDLRIFSQMFGIKEFVEDFYYQRTIPFASETNPFYVYSESVDQK